MFVNLYTETHYSMNGSNITIEALVKKAISYGYRSLAITDDKLYGAIKFYKECVKNNVKPIIGLRLFIEGINQESKNLVLCYAMNNQGYKNLLRIASLSSLHTVLSIQDLVRYESGVMVVVVTDQSEFLQHFRNQKTNDLNELYVSLSSIKQLYFAQSEETELNEKFETLKKLIVVDYVKYLNKEDTDVYRVLSQIFHGTTSNILDDEKNYHFKNESEIRNKYQGLEKAIERVASLVNKIDIKIEFGNILLPNYPHDKKGTSRDYLRALVMKGLEKRIKDKKVNKKLYLDRIDYELNVIDTMGYNDYFLIVWDFVKYSRKKQYLVGPGRGSAAASLVSYCLGITSIDSIEYDLVFERFLNPERITMPDIDMDLPDDKRDDIIQYVRDFYGINKVASICTFGTFLSKSAIRDTARILEVHGMLLEEIVKESNNYSNISEMVEESTKVKNIIEKDTQAKAMLEIAAKIEGLMRHVSTHAAGIIVTEKNLTEYTAVQPGLLDMMQTQYEAKDLEDLGLLKIDFLGLRNLTSIDKIVQLINETEGSKLDIYKVPVDDKNTFELLKRVETTGIFQLESQGMRSLIGQMQIDCFEDIVTILALFRPGPMENIPSYINRRFNKEDVEYPHPILEEILKPTNGIIIYQEQIIKIASLFAGYSLGEADLLRRAVSKKQEEVLQKERANFVRKASKEGRDPKTSNEIYDYIVKFANYGFNRAHSVAYAMVSYWMAYLKANYPKYFIGVLTSSVIGSETQMKNYIYEANKLGVRVLPPSVNLSSEIFVPEGDNLRYPLLGIKNVGLSTVRQIVEERKNGKYKNYVDFVSRNQKNVNKRAVEYLIYAGAFDEFNISKRSMIDQYEDVLRFSQYGNFISSEDFVLSNLDEYDYKELEEYEKLALGFNLAMNPILEFADYIKKHNLLTPSEVKQKHLKQTLRVVGVVSGIRKIKTKNNDEMAFMSIEDEFKKIDCVLFPEVFKTYYNEVNKGDVGLFMVDVDERNRSLQLIIKKVHKLKQ